MKYVVLATMCLAVGCASVPDVSEPAGNGMEPRTGDDVEDTPTVSEKSEGSIEIGVGETALYPPPDWYIAYKGDTATHRCEAREGGYSCQQLGEIEELGTEWFEAGIRPAGDTHVPQLRTPTPFEPGMLEEGGAVVTIGQHAVWLNGEKVATLEGGILPPEQKKGGQNSLTIRKLVEQGALLKSKQAAVLIDRTARYQLVTEVFYSLGQARKNRYIFAHPGPEKTQKMDCQNSEEGLACSVVENGATSVRMTDIFVRRMVTPLIQIGVKKQCTASPQDTLTTVRDISGLRGCYVAELERNSNAKGTLDISVAYGQRTTDANWNGKFEIRKNGDLSRDFMTCVEMNAEVPEAPEDLGECIGEFRVDLEPGPSVSVDAASVKVFGFPGNGPGEIDKKKAGETLSGARDQFAKCMTRDDARNVVLSIRVGADGRPLSSSLSPQSENDTDFGNCLHDVVKRLQFPEPTGGSYALLTIPFELQNP